MQNLFSEFQETSAEEWKKKIEADLKGVTFEQLTRKTRDGIEISPFYHDVKIADVVPITKSTAWEICAEILVQKEKEANALALQYLQNGVSGLRFVINGKKDLSVLLNDISIQHIYLQFQLIGMPDEFLFDFTTYLNANSLKWEDLNVCVIHDELNHLIQEGCFKMGENEFKNGFLNTWNSCKSNNLVVDATIYNNAGATTVTELSCALAQLNEYLHILDRSKQLSQLKKVTVELAIDTLFFEQIAKLRAFRNLTALLFEQYNCLPQLHIHCSTSNVYRSAFDSYSNLLRDTLAGMAAVIGNCDSLIIRSFSEKVEQQTLANRMSRNQQLIFKEESYLDKVTEIAKGSYFIESLTQSICEKSWEAFKTIEQKGGFIHEALNHEIGSLIKEQQQALINDYKEGKRVLVGLNKFINSNDAPVKDYSEQKIKSGVQTLTISQVILA
jgi:methylmalonyl-CoA mutase